MNYDSVFDKWHEECGVFGIYDRTVDVARYVYWGLFALQHRGQESAGIAVTDGHDVELKKGMGLLTEAIKELPSLPSYMGTGHVRYSTTGPIIRVISSLWLFTTKAVKLRWLTMET